MATLETAQLWLNERGVFVHTRSEVSSHPLIYFSPAVDTDGEWGCVALRYRHGRSFNVDIRGQRSAKVASWLEWAMARRRRRPAS